MDRNQIPDRTSRSAAHLPAASRSGSADLAASLSRPTCRPSRTERVVMAACPSQLRGGAKQAGVVQDDLGPLRQWPTARPGRPGMARLRRPWPRRRRTAAPEGSLPMVRYGPLRRTRRPDDARIVEHALDSYRRGQPGSARPLLGYFRFSLPVLLGSQGPGPGPCERTGYSAIVWHSGRARFTVPVLLRPRARLSGPVAAAGRGSAIVCAPASRGPLRRCRRRHALGAPRTRRP